MKILQFIASKNRGGAENVVASLTNALFQDGVDVELLLLKNSLVAKQIDARLTITYLHFSSRFNPLLYLELLGVVFRKKPDIIHTHSAKATELIHALRYFISALHVATKHNGRKGKIFNKIRHVTAVSCEVKKSITPRTATIIYNGIAPKPITPIAHPQNPFHIYAIGRLDPIKAYNHLIEACSKLSFDFRLHIVGEGKERDPLEVLAKQLGVGDKIIFEGFQSDIPTLMNQSDLVIISSHSEGFSIVLIEALFYAPLLLSTKVGVATEIMDEAFLMEHKHMSEKIETIFHNYKHYTTQFDNLCLRLQPLFLLTKSVTHYEDYYTNLLKKITTKD